MWIPKIFEPSGWLCENCKKFEVSYFKPSWSNCYGYNRHYIWIEVIVNGYDFGAYTFCGRVGKGRLNPNAEKTE